MATVSDDFSMISAVALLGLLGAGLGATGLAIMYFDSGSCAPLRGYSSGEVIRLDPRAIRDEAIGSGWVNLTAFGETYSLVATPIEDMAPGGRIETVDDNGDRVSIAVRPTTFQVEVPGTNIRGTLNLNGAWVRGMISVGDRDIYFEPCDPKGGVGPVATAVYCACDQSPLAPPAGSHQEPEL